MLKVTLVIDWQRKPKDVRSHNDRGNEYLPERFTIRDTAGMLGTRIKVADIRHNQIILTRVRHSMKKAQASSSSGGSCATS